MSSTKTCIACGRDSSATPLLNLDYQGGVIHICAQHLPILIHDPGRLVGVLPGAENLQPSEHHD